MLGRQVELTQEFIKNALDPVHFVQIRNRTGGPAIEQAKRMHEERLSSLLSEEDLLVQIRSGYQKAHGQLAAEVARRVAGKERD